MNDQITEKLNAFFSRYTSVPFHKGDVLLTPSENVKEILYLKKGVVKMSAFSEDGVEVVLHLFRPGAFFPLMLVTSGHSNSYYFTALEQGEYARAPVDEVVAFVKGDDGVIWNFVERLSQAMMGLILRIEQDAFHDAYKRTAALFVYLAERFGEACADGIEITLDLHHQDLAAWLGIRRETASRQIEKLLDTGLIKMKDRRFFVTNLEKLNAYL